MSLRTAIEAGDVASVVTAVRSPDELGRREARTAFTAMTRDREVWWDGTRGAALSVAVVGCQPTAATAAQILGRPSVGLPEEAVAPVLEVARALGVPWLVELANRLATVPDPDWRFVAGLIRAEGAPPPTGDRFVEGWATDLGMRDLDRPLADRLRDDPFLRALLPRLFEVDTVGLRLHFPDLCTGRENGFADAVAQLSREGVLDRADLIGATLDRLLRGDRPKALRAFIMLHETLAPTAAEVVARPGDYLRLLTDGPVSVATMAQRVLRTVDLPDRDALLEASRVVLARPEKALVKAQLAWLGVAGPAAPVVFSSPRGDDLPALALPQPAPPPITDVDTLVEEVALLLRRRIPDGPVERVLDGLVRLAAVDDGRLAGALRPLLRDARGWVFRRHRNEPHCLCESMGDLLRAAAGLEREREPQDWSSENEPDPARAAPAVLVRRRLEEATARLGSTPSLLCTPTSMTGSLDGSVLLERIASLGDREPWPVDLTQALLRLPLAPDNGLAAQAEALGSSAGKALAARLRSGGLPQPGQYTVSVEFSRKLDDADVRESFGLWPRRLLVETAPPAGLGFELVELLDVTVGEYYSTRAEEDWSRHWALAMPHHRGVVAAAALPLLAAAADRDIDDGSTAILPLLADCDGDGGVALDLGLAYAVSARRPADRIAALDAFLTMAATGTLNPEGIGELIGVLSTSGPLKPTRIVEVLRDAASAGAPLSVWRLLAAALPHLLRGAPPETPPPRITLPRPSGVAPKVPRGTPELLALATETAVATGVRLPVDGLDAVAAWPGSSRVVVEARRLAEALRSAGGTGGSAAAR
ncbi:hypothetical protein [Winogradskya humida]|uniref:Secreted protein n=1 Tax=Winogradskya humida TaxID=113566 RepID=A0ABQ4A4F8_9ACTN|nr:hypothetical protein [Actinoplanes humidus]GIE25742.1 hypothetical protein Ahu01nite_088440 [Actinoplanes humidus]